MTSLLQLCCCFHRAMNFWCQPCRNSPLQVYRSMSGSIKIWLYSPIFQEEQNWGKVTFWCVLWSYQTSENWCLDHQIEHLVKMAKRENCQFAKIEHLTKMEPNTCIIARLCYVRTIQGLRPSLNPTHTYQNTFWKRRKRKGFSSKMALDNCRRMYPNLCVWKVPKRMKIGVD